MVTANFKCAVISLRWLGDIPVCLTVLRSKHQVGANRMIAPDLTPTPRERGSRTSTFRGRERPRPGGEEVKNINGLKMFKTY